MADRTAEYIIKLIGKDEQLKQKINETINGLKKATAASEDLKKVNASMVSGLKSVGAAIGAAFALSKITDFTIAAVNLAAQAEGVQTAFEKLNNPTLLDDLRKATRNTVADIDLMKTAIQARNFKIPLEQLATYFKFATNRALETGQSVDYLVDSIIMGIGRQSPLILDNLGLSAKEISTEFQRTGDFGKAVGNIIKTELTKGGEVMDTAATKTAQLAAAWENLKESVGAAVIGTGAQGGIVGWVTEQVKEADDVIYTWSNKNIGFWKALGITLDAGLWGTQGKAAIAAQRQLEQSIDAYTQMEQAQQALGKQSIKTNEIKVRSLSAVNEELKEAIGLQTQIDVTDRAAIEASKKKVAQLTAEKEAYEKLFAAKTGGKRESNLAPITSKSGQLVSTSSGEMIPGLEQSSVTAIAMKDTLAQMAEDAIEQQEAIMNLGSSFAYLGSSIGGAAGSWISFAGALAENIPMLITQITALSKAQVSTSMTTASAKQSEALSSGLASGSALPFPANIIAIASIIASIAGIIASIPKPKKFAAGGIISGPTLGLMGEYPGASNNPEVVAPLNKLKGMIGNKGQHVSVEDIVIDGNKLRIVMKASERQVKRYT